jgi:hypothetical protein
MTEHSEPAEHSEPGQIGSEGSGRVPYTEPVLRDLGALRELTFKSGEKSSVEKRPEKAVRETGS